MLEKLLKQQDPILDLDQPTPTPWMLSHVTDCSSIEAEVATDEEMESSEEEALEGEEEEEEQEVQEDSEEEEDGEAEAGSKQEAAQEELGQKYTPIRHYRCAICKDSTKDAFH
jgi:hypothetical protein